MSVPSPLYHPAPKLEILGGEVLVLGSLAVVVGTFVVLGVPAVATFLVVSALLMPDRRTVAENQQQDGMTESLKNIALADGTPAVTALDPNSWTCSLDISPTD